MARSILPQPLYPPLHWGLKHLFPQCLWELTDPSLPEQTDRDHSPKILLSFDDGPHPDYTPALLDCLKRWKIQANFFLLGEQVERWPQIVRAIMDQGHHIGLHGYRHISFPQLSSIDLQKSLRRTQQAITDASGSHQDPAAIRDVRPPNGLFFPQTLDHLCRWGYRPVMWSVVPEDWVLPPISVVIQRILDQIYPGAIVVLHDGPFGGSQVVATVDQLLPRLLDQGFEFMTLASDAQKH